MLGMLDQKKLQATCALIVLTAAASGGIASRYYIPGLWGQVIFMVTRFGIIGLPIIWFVAIEKGTLSLSPPTPRDGWIGTVVGLGLLGTIWVAYKGLGSSLIDAHFVQEQAAQVGLSHPVIYGLAALYFTVINALVEEYIWRWFVYRQCEVLVPQLSAIGLAAFCFTLHHTIALLALTGNLWVVSIGSLGVFGAGMIWSWCFLATRSIWSGYWSHLLADLAIAVVGWDILFKA